MAAVELCILTRISDCSLQNVGQPGHSFKTQFNKHTCNKVEQSYIHICTTHNNHGTYIWKYAGNSGSNTSS
jgi:hypothetical protein